MPTVHYAEGTLVRPLPSVSTIRYVITLSLTASNTLLSIVFGNFAPLDQHHDGGSSDLSMGVYLIEACFNSVTGNVL